MIPIYLIEGTTTFAYREEGMPLELQASPASQQALLLSSFTTVEQEDIPSIKNPLSNTLVTQTDEENSQDRSLSISMNPDAQRMVDNLIESEKTESQRVIETTYSGNEDSIAREPSTPDFAFSSSNRVGNDTTYGFDTTLDVSELSKAARSHLLQNQPYISPQVSPQLRLSSLSNSPFTPKADERALTSQPYTTSGMSPIFSSCMPQYAFASETEQASQSINLSLSSMQDPSSISITQPIFSSAHPGQYHQPIYGGGKSRTGKDFGVIGRPVSGTYKSNTSSDQNELRSSDPSMNSPWALTGESTRNALNIPTPQNGQGNT